MVDKVADRPTRFSAELLDAAAAEGLLESRSAKMQLEHWARVGMHVSMRDTAARRRVEATLAGDVDLADLTAEEQLAANAEIDALIAEQTAQVSLGGIAATAGITTVAIDAEGRIVTYAPDGSATVLDEV